MTNNISPKIATSTTDEEIEEEYEWATTTYLYDITQEYYQVISETTTGNGVNSTTAYSYGLERIAGYANTSTLSKTTTYVYDGRRSLV